MTPSQLKSPGIKCHQWVIAVLLALGTLVLGTRADCIFEKKYIEDSNRNFVMKDINGNYELLLRDSVPPAATFYLVCNEKTVRQETCTTTNVIQPPMPKAACTRPSATLTELKPVVLKPDYKVYSVRYKVGGSEVELYRSVYSKKHLRALYTYHWGYTGNVATNRPKTDFSLDGLMSGKEAESFKKEEVFKRFNLLLGKKQKFVPSPTLSVIERGHLAPSADFLFDHDMRATFKLVNVVPQFGALNRDNWASVESWVRAEGPKRGRSRHTKFQVVTGGLGVLSLPHSTTKKATDIYLLPNKRNPLPKWVYKLVEKQGKCVAFIAYNNVHPKMTKPRAICTRVACPSDISLRDDLDSGYVYCCDARAFKRKFVPSAPIC